MNIPQLFKRLWVFVRPYRILVVATLLLTVLGSFLTQVNAYVLRYTVDELTVFTKSGDVFKAGASLLLTITAILLGKELLYTAIQYGQKFYGEKLRIFISRDISQTIVEKILPYKMAFYTSPK